MKYELENKVLTIYLKGAINSSNYLDLALVINPGYAEREDTVRLNHALHDLCLFELGVLVVNFLDGFQNFLNSLQILFLQRILGLKACHDVSRFHDNCLVFG